MSRTIPVTGQSGQAARHGRIEVLTTPFSATIPMAHGSRVVLDEDTATANDFTLTVTSKSEYLGDVITTGSVDALDELIARAIVLRDLIRAQNA